MNPRSGSLASSLCLCVSVVALSCSRLPLRAAGREHPEHEVGHAADGGILAALPRIEHGVADAREAAELVERMRAGTPPPTRGPLVVRRSSCPGVIAIFGLVLLLVVDLESTCWEG